MLGTMLARNIDQKEFNALIDELRIKIQRLKRLTEKVTPNVAEKAELATLKEECCITESDKLNFKAYLAKKGYSPQLNGIRFGIENITIIPSTGDGTPVMRGSATVLKNIDYSDLCFQNCDFNQVDLSHCVIKNSEFSKCRWTEASLRSCQIENVTFERNTFDDTDFSHASIKNSKFSYATKHTNTTFFDTSFHHVRNFNATYQGCNFVRATLKDFRGGNFLTFEDCIIPKTLKSSVQKAGKIQKTNKPKIGIIWRQNLVGHTGYKLYQDIKARGGIPVKIDYDPNQTDFDAAKLSKEISEVLSEEEITKPIPQIIVDSKKKNIQSVMNLAKEYAGVINGLVLTGGLDIEPQLYIPNYVASKNPLHSQIGTETLPLRSLLEFGLIKYFARTGKPLMGICRGNQMVNVFYGGNVHQDLPTTHNLVIHGIQNQIKMDSADNVGLIRKPGQNYTQTGYGSHHQAVKQAGEGLSVVAKNHGLPYALENKHGSPIFLTQFHPEVYRDPKLKNNLSPINNYILESFHQAVKDSKKKRAAQLQIKAELAKLKKTSGAIRNGKACIRPSEDPASLVPVSVGPLRPESMAYPNDDSLSHQIRSILFQFFNTYHLPYTDSGHGYEPPQPHAYHFRPFILGR